jgi:P27 family predicted phage terminase small subunit
MPDRTASKTARPRPPDGMEGEALLEWDRLCDDLAAAGRLDAADRAVMHVYCETWAVWRTATRHVNTFGPVVPASLNGAIGRSPFYAVQKETAAQLRNLLTDLGLTPQARGKGAGSTGEEPLDV